MPYLDNAATSYPKPESVLRAVERALAGAANAGRGAHTEGAAASAAVYSCREKAASFFRAEGPEQVAFTLNATHALNIAIKGFLRKGGVAVVSGFEHNAVTRPLYALRSFGVRTLAARAPLWDDDATVRAFDRAITVQTSLVVMTAVSNVFGYILPFARVAALCAKRGVPFVLDASQAAGTVDAGIDLPGVSVLCAPGHKGLFGPAGTGMLVLSRGITLPTLLEGGSGFDSRLTEMPEDPPERYEAGTQNIPGVAGLAAGFDFVASRGSAALLAHERALLDLAAERLGSMEGVSVYKSPDPAKQAGVLSFTVPSLDHNSLGSRLAARSFSVRTGLHCAPLAHDTAGTGEDGTIRISPSAFNTREDILAFCEALAESVAEEKEENDRAGA